MKFRTFAVAVVVAALVGAGGTLGVQALRGGGGHGYSGPPAGQLSDSWLDGIDINELAQQGLYLSQPPRDYYPKLSPAYAKEVAAHNQFMNVPARQIVLAHLQTDTMGGFDGQVYVVNFDPDKIPAECPGSRTTLAFALVDSDNARVISGQTVGSPPSALCHHGLIFATPTIGSTPDTPNPAATAAR